MIPDDEKRKWFWEVHWGGLCLDLQFLSGDFGLSVGVWVKKREFLWVYIGFRVGIGLFALGIEYMR